MLGIVSTGIIADKHLENAGTIYGIGIAITLLLFPIVYFADKKVDQVMYGSRVIVDLQNYRVPSLCPETGREATEIRMAEYIMTGGVASVRGGFPVMLSPEAATAYDKRFSKKVKGIKVVRAACNKITLRVKDNAYLQAMRDANRETGAVSV